MSDPRPSPPTASPTTLPLEHLILIALLGALAIVLVGDFVPLAWVQYYAPRLWLPIWLLCCAVNGGSRVAGRTAWLTRSLRFGRGKLIQVGGGAHTYAAIGLVCFGWLELARLTGFIESLAALAGGRDAIRDFVKHLFDFGIDSFMNGVYAAAWPAFWKKTFDAGQQWPAIAVAWVLYEAGRWGIGCIPGRTGAEPPA